MMILTWLLTFVLMIDCLILGLLVLIQLPKKEAGMGQAFGGSTTDALFGAGSGTALTKMTKYVAGIFFVLTLLLAVMHGKAARATAGDFRAKLNEQDKLSLVAPTNKPATPPVTRTNLDLKSTAGITNAAATNVVPAAPAAPAGEKPK